MLDERNHSSTSSDHDQDTWPPGAEACEKAQEWTKGLVGPDVDRAFPWEHESQLPGNYRARNEKGEEPQDPIYKGSGACARYNTRITNKEDDCDENGDHVKGVQNFGENASCDAF